MNEFARKPVATYGAPAFCVLIDREGAREIDEAPYRRVRPRSTSCSTSPRPSPPAGTRPAAATRTARTSRAA